MHCIFEPADTKTFLLDIQYAWILLSKASLGRLNGSRDNVNYDILKTLHEKIVIRCH